MSYQSRLNKHLADYKLRHLGIKECGEFFYRGSTLKRAHILPRPDQARNLLNEAAAVLKGYKRRLTLHRYFHHLNSSQAFALNLFFPYFEGPPESASALLRALGQDGVLASWVPEAVPIRHEGSNIDVLWHRVDGVQTFCEVKLSETSFGKAADDSRHRGKFNDIYRDKLAPQMKNGRIEKVDFFGAYQFYRNVWHMIGDEQSQLIFLLPRANAALQKRLDELLPRLVPKTRARIYVVAIEDVITKLSRDEQCSGAMRAYADKLKDKYLI
jgi:hypothetical protein